MVLSHCRKRKFALSLSPQNWLAMKLCLILLITATLAVNANGFSQATVTWSAKSATLQSAFKAIEQQTGFTIFCDDAIFRDAKTVTLSVKKQSLDEFLKSILKDQPWPLEYIYRDQVIVIRKVQIPQTRKIDDQSVPIVNATIDVRGVVKDESGKPAEGVIVRVKGKEIGTVTNANGEFFLLGIDENAILVFSSINLQTFEVKVDRRNEFGVTLKARIRELADVSVTTVNTGYQQIPKERATGSFSFVDSTVLSRVVTTNILDKLDGAVLGVLFTKNKGAIALNQSDYSVRGRATIFANPNPLIVLDNFPYDGDLSTINPNDVESITILKDAAASSIWGARASNGVIVITSKKGRVNQPVKVGFNTALSISDKPDLFYQNRLGASDVIDAELYLNNLGYYNSVQSSISRAGTSAVVDILARRKLGQISSVDSTQQIDALRKQDIRNDLAKFFYQKQFNQQYSLNLSGGSSYNQYYVSFGYDNNRSSLTYNSIERYTINASNNIFLFDNKLEIGNNIRYAKSLARTGNSPNFNGINLVYNRLADDDGNPIRYASNLRLGYSDTAGQGKLLDWNFRPLEDIRNRNKYLGLEDMHVKLSLKYKLLEGLDLSSIYEYAHGSSNLFNLESEGVSATRDQINNFTQINYATGAVTRPIPLGAILNTSESDYNTQQLRIQSNYSKKWESKHVLNAIAGFEVRNYQTLITTKNYYGYNIDTKLFATNIDYFNTYPTFVTGGLANIATNNSILQTTNNFLSYYCNAGYNYLARYEITASVRKDEANILGKVTNEKGVPLWSTGVGWLVSKEGFFRSNLIPYLKLKASYGYNGNLDLSAASALAITYRGNNSFGNIYSAITNNPNDKLSWERSEVYNIGVEFQSINRILTGSFEYYIKNGIDLLGSGLIAPQTGISSFYGNIANMKTQGFDILLKFKYDYAKTINHEVIFQLTKVKEKVTNYKLAQSNINNYVIGGTSFTSPSLTPLVGYPLYSVFSYKYNGLDVNGDPLVVFDGLSSKSYASVTSSTDVNNMVYGGSQIPTVFGNLLNFLSFHNFSISANIVYKFGYVFRRPSIDFATIFPLSGPGAVHSDYLLRWKKPGDENITNIPSLVYPNNTTRNNIYTYSDVLVEKGDHIRLQDINLSYDLKIKNNTIKAAKFFAVLSNIGIIWRANKYNIDPDFIQGYPNPFMVTAGAKFEF
jgi:TonB-linked SusC/RagA family outer membrane protein